MTTLANKLVDDVELVSATWSGRLDVPADDPYHFDHPLDHIPGMALIGGLLELVRRSGAAELDLPNRRLSLSLAFPAFCELDGPVVLQAVRVPTGMSGVDTSLSLLAEQGTQVVCEVDLTLRATTEHTVPGAGADTSSLTADQGLVHRRRRENVFVTGMAGHGERRVVALRPAPDGHALAVAPGQPYRAEFVVDAARQFCTMICHVEHDRPADMVFIMSGMTVDLPCGLGGDAYLRWSVAPPGRGKLAMGVEVVAGDPDGPACGSVDFEYFAVTPSVYGRLRGDVREAA